MTLIPRPRVPAWLRRSPWLLVAAQLGVERGRLAPLAAALLASTLLPLAAPQLMAEFVDRAVSGASLGVLLQLGAAYLAVAAAGQAAGIAATTVASGVAW